MARVRGGAGLRTRQRRAIERALAAAGRPLTPQEIRRAAGRFSARIGIATVYRTVKRLAASGRISAVVLPSGPVRYEPAGKAHHHHLACRKCGGVYEASGCPGRLLPRPPRGFRLEGHDVILYGVCRECA